MAYDLFTINEMKHQPHVRLRKKSALGQLDYHMRKIIGYKDYIFMETYTKYLISGLSYIPPTVRDYTGMA